MKLRDKAIIVLEKCGDCKYCVNNGRFDANYDYCKKLSTTTGIFVIENRDTIHTACTLQDVDIYKGTDIVDYIYDRFWYDDFKNIDKIIIVKKSKEIK